MNPPEGQTTTRWLPYLFSGYRLFLIMAVHSALSALFFRSYWGFALIPVWLLNLIAVQEPIAPRVHRHEDVAEFMATDAGMFLTRRRCWVPRDERFWVAPLAVVLLLLPGAAVGFIKSGADQFDSQVAQYVFNYAWAGMPLVITAAFFMENILKIPVVYGPLVLFYIVFFVIFIVQEKEEQIVFFSAVVPAVILPLYSLDLLRLLRRSWRPSRR